ncbi:XRE family transcriptional regulator [Streptomyces sp. NPDC046977]|uniref:XRE family transcriptional regulator n=1 Tax=Streptomyces sp. NPDC046977 TaxID=3154703 RepID=UPI0033EE37DB
MAEQKVRTDLSDLVRERRAALRLSLRDFADLTIDPDDQDAGPTWKFGRYRNLENAEPNVTPPTPAELRGLAAAGQIPLGRVREAAAAQFFGVQTHWHPSDEIRVLVHQTEEMTEEQQAMLFDFAETIWRRRSDDDKA